MFGTIGSGQVEDSPSLSAGVVTKYRASDPKVRRRPWRAGNIKLEVLMCFSLQEGNCCDPLLTVGLQLLPNPWKISTFASGMSLAKLG